VLSGQLTWEGIHTMNSLLKLPRKFLHFHISLPREAFRRRKIYGSERKWESYTDTRCIIIGAGVSIVMWKKSVYCIVCSTSIVILKQRMKYVTYVTLSQLSCHYVNVSIWPKPDRTVRCSFVSYHCHSKIQIFFVFVLFRLLLATALW